MDAEFNRNKILQLLDEAAQRDPGHKLFGTNTHAYQLNPPLTADEIAAYEHRIGVTFPDDYRYFVTNVGNGGAGPFYGVFPFGQQDDMRGFCNWDRGYLVGDIATPFQHTDVWNLDEAFGGCSPIPVQTHPKKKRIG